ncbi:uncharacterized protein LOC113340957 [Papaver somniferum]|uniref:uncharacterized protein LOC113340957 n=1 Tax=Papaver somniferum TaxID=3469 RepID=UPI000E6F6D89|nr:uncharacterized protein LOC113340957 [Papaver somniferum]
MSSTIHTIRDDQGNWLEDIAQVTGLLSSHFKKIFTSSNPSSSDIDEALRFVSPIITYDINASLIAIPTSQEIIDTVNMMAPWSSPGPDGFPPGFFRDNWDIVHSESALVANRQIHDNIIITHEILHSFKIKKKSSKNGHLAIKLDLSKAFDGLEWGNFLSVHGIRRGDCLSPYIFILCMEALSRLFINVEKEKLFQGFKFNKNSPSISHLFFADDCMLFCKASITYAKNILKVINVFAKASGQAINLEKSGFVTSSKIHHRHVKLLSKALHMKFLCNSEKYLGTPLFIGKNKTNSFGFLIDNFYARLNAYKKSNLNIVGRTIVTKHVLSSLSIYHMACFPLPKTITGKIDVIQRIFWWSKKNPKHAAYFRSWGDIGKSKSSGGLGIRNSHAINRVFICKIGWRLLKFPNSLMFSFLKNKYFPNQNLLEIDKAANTSSWIWKRIVNGLRFIKANIVVKINNGANTYIWNSNWIPGYSVPPTSQNPIHGNFTCVKDLLDNSLSCVNIDLLNDLFSTDEVTRIRSIPLNSALSDSLMWAHTSSGKFSIKSSYRVYIDDISSSEDASFWIKWLFPFWSGLSLLHLISVDVEWLDDLFIFWHDTKLGASPFNVFWPSIAFVVMCYSSSSNPVCSSVKIHIADVDHIMFVDGSFKDFKMGSGIVCCDLTGNVICSRSDFGWIPDAVGAKAAALFLAISWAEEMNLQKVFFLSDCLQLVNFVNAASTDVNWRSVDLLNRCRISLDSNVAFKFCI